jgi:hypothetical protein
MSEISRNNHKDSWIINTIEKCPSWEADCFFSDQYIRRLLQTKHFNIFISQPFSIRFIQSIIRLLRDVFLPGRFF